MTVHTPSIRREVWEQPAMRRALAARDITGVYQLLIAAGVSQRAIGHITKQSQSEVSEIVHGRRVTGYDLLVRIADRLGVSRAAMGLAYAGGVVDGDPDSTTDGEELTEAVKRRRFINAVAGAVVWGHPVVRELLEPARLDVPTPLPSRLGTGDVDALRALTERMRLVARQYGGQADVVSNVARRSMTLLQVPAAESTGAALRSALSELHTVAGWCCFDTGLSPDTVRAHFTRGMELATNAGDTYRAVNAIYHAAMATQDAAPNDSLKLFQLGYARLGQHGGHPRTDALRAWLRLDSARSLLMLDEHKQARSELAAARDVWHDSDDHDQFDRADFDHVTALAHLELGMLDSAEHLAAMSVQTWGDARRDAAQAETTLAVIYVQADDPRGYAMTEQAVRDVAGLRSARARNRLVPLIDALDERRTREARELADHARQVAAARAP